jgi:tetratricopeptide (TPR) repeat protein
MMALSDKACLQCGAEADAGAIAQAYLQKAEALRSQGHWAGAEDQYLRALKESLTAAQQAQAWQRLGLVREKLAAQRREPALLERAGEAFEKSLQADPVNEMVHQLWIANLTQQGLNLKAVDYYKQRLAQDPGDELAARMKKVALLAAEFKATPVQVMSSVARDEGVARFKLLGWFLIPTRFKIGMAVSSTVMNLATALYFVVYPPAAAGPHIPHSEEEDLARQVGSLGMGDWVMTIGSDPTFLLFCTLLTGMWSVYLFRAKKKK